MKADDVRCVGRFKQSGGSVGLPIVDVFGEVMMRPSIQEVKERQGGGAVTHYRLALGVVRGCGVWQLGGQHRRHHPRRSLLVLQVLLIRGREIGPW